MTVGLFASCSEQSAIAFLLSQHSLALIRGIRHLLPCSPLRPSFSISCQASVPRTLLGLQMYLLSPIKTVDFRTRARDYSRRRTERSLGHSYLESRRSHSRWRAHDCTHMPFRSPAKHKSKYHYVPAWWWRSLAEEVEATGMRLWLWRFSPICSIEQIENPTRRSRFGEPMAYRRVGWFGSGWRSALYTPKNRWFVHLSRIIDTITYLLTHSYGSFGLLASAC